MCNHPIIKIDISKEDCLKFSDFMDVSSITGESLPNVNFYLSNIRERNLSSLLNHEEDDNVGNKILFLGLSRIDNMPMFELSYINDEITKDTLLSDIRKSYIKKLNIYFNNSTKFVEIPSMKTTPGKISTVYKLK